MKIRCSSEVSTALRHCWSGIRSRRRRAAHTSVRSSESRSVSIDADFDFRPLELSAGLESVLPESALELYLDRDAPAVAGYSGMLVKTQADTGRGYSHHLLLLGFDGAVHKLIPLGSNSACDCAAAPLNYFHISGDPAAAGTEGNSLVRVNSSSSAITRSVSSCVAK